MRRFVASLGVVLAIVQTVAAQSETHTNLQAVDSMGVSTNALSYPLTIRGVLLNDPEEMLDFTWDSGAEAGGRMGAQWQVFFQTVATNDHGGTACWMGQNYNSMGAWIPAGNFYTEAAWSDEMVRVNYDASTAHHFRKGDLVEVTANKTLFYGGKRNINESHRVTAANDFSIALVQAGYGLPDPEVITLTNLVSSGTNQIFDATRQTGCEFYQGVRVRIESLRLSTNYYGSTGWGKTNWSDRLCTVTDGAGRYFTLRMPLTDLGPAPTDWFSAVGIINQESGSGSDGTFGYELFVQEIGPTVRFVVTEGKALAYWSGTYTNYILEYTTNLNDSSSWTNVEAAPTKWIAVEEAASGEMRYYRLKQRE